MTGTPDDKAAEAMDRTVAAAEQAQADVIQRSVAVAEQYRAAVADVDPRMQGIARLCFAAEVMGAAVEDAHCDDCRHRTLKVLLDLLASMEAEVGARFIPTITPRANAPSTESRQ